MFNPDVISHEDSSLSLSLSRRAGQVAWAALGAIVLTALILAVTIGFGTGSSSQSQSANSLPQVRDTPPSAIAAPQILRAAVAAGYVRDPNTHGLLLIQTPSADQSAATTYADSPATMRGRELKLGR